MRSSQFWQPPTWDNYQKLIDSAQEDISIDHLAIAEWLEISFLTDASTRCTRSANMGIPAVYFGLLHHYKPSITSE